MNRGENIMARNKEHDESREEKSEGIWGGYSKDSSNPFWNPQSGFQGAPGRSWPLGPESYFAIPESEPATMLYEDNGHLVVNVELPNVKEEDIKIQWLKNTLVITGEKQTKRPPPEQPVLLSKHFWTGKFHRVINLGFVPENTNLIQAKLANGVLTIKIKMPKTASVEPELVHIGK